MSVQVRIYSITQRGLTFDCPTPCRWIDIVRTALDTPGIVKSFGYNSLEPPSSDVLLDASWSSKGGSLNSRLASPVEEEEGKISVFLYLFGNSNFCLRFSYRCFNEGRPWPPADNWKGDDPLNFHSIGYSFSSTGKHLCSACGKANEQIAGESYNPMYDNALYNLVIIAFGPGPTRIAHNRLFLLRVMEKFGRYPLTNEKLSPGKIKEIRRACWGDEIQLF